MNSFAAIAIAAIVTLVIAFIGLVVSATLFSQASIGGNTVILAFCLAAVGAGTITHRRLRRSR